MTSYHVISTNSVMMNRLCGKIERLEQLQMDASVLCAASLRFETTLVRQPLPCCSLPVSAKSMIPKHQDWQTGIYHNHNPLLQKHLVCSRGGCIWIDRGRADVTRKVTFYYHQVLNCAFQNVKKCKNISVQVESQLWTLVNRTHTYICALSNSTHLNTFYN